MIFMRLEVLRVYGDMAQLGSATWQSRLPHRPSTKQRGLTTSKCLASQKDGDVIKARLASEPRCDVPPRVAYK